MGWQRVFERRMDDALDVAEAEVGRVQSLTAAKVTSGEMTDDEARAAVAAAARHAIDRIKRRFGPN